VLAEAGDYLIAAAEGAIGPDHIRAEIGDVITGTANGRADADEITVFESLGLAIEDLAAAALVYRLACERRTGMRAPF
jgi:ornithine cyclodeaminase/alanine dehydrogenase-like protein (mu-crystallin family)